MKVKMANGVVIETLKCCKERKWLKPVLLVGSQRKNVKEGKHIIGSLKQRLDELSEIKFG
jgi:hypothetical protein